MCYDISFTVSLRKLSDYFPDMIFDEQIAMNFEPVHIVGHNYGEQPVLYRNRDDTALHCRLMEWGCIPFFVKDEDQYKKQRAGMLNARSERILDDTKSYWYKIRNRRCLVPVTGFYEHREVKGSAKKIPYYIQLKEQETFFLPGLYSVAELPDKKTGELQQRFTFTIITREANAVMKQIHNSGENKWRMPLLLPASLSADWLSADLSPEKYKEILQFEMPSDALKFHPVYTIRSPKERPDEKAKNEFWQWENVPDITL